MTDGHAGPTSPGTHGAPRADEVTFRALLAAERPELAELPLVPGPTGWDNAHWLLPDGLAVRLPRREVAVPLIANEVRALPTFGADLPLAVPVPVHVGRSLEGVWPWPWTIVPWFEGERADLAYPPADATAHAVALGAFLAALHVPAPDDVARNPYRGVPLAARAERTAAAFAAIGAGGTLEADVRRSLRRHWERALATPPSTDPPVWVHGDLHPGNQLVHDRALVAVVDWGDVTRGDAAADLAAAWWTLPTAAHDSLREAYGGVDDELWSRAVGWATAIAVQVLVDGPATGDQAILVAARRTAQRLATGA